MLNTIGYNLRLLRFKHNFTLAQVAQAIDISVNTLSRYENNERFPQKEIILKLADFYDVKVEYILIGD
ncbi:helix-turn-helix transcriptional regulator [Cytobacillus suaedae]|nr:helix-turn-helix transcriptional regulator [Cytobacillus suaedae]